MAELPFGVRAAFFAYSFGFEVVVWLALVPALWLRTLVSGSDFRDLHQRLGRPPGSPSCHEPRRPKPLLVHAVSVGEMHAAVPLVNALVASGHHIVLTTGTAAGLDAAWRLAQAQPSVVDAIYLPWDRSAIRPWLARLAPSAVVVIETEIWPNLYQACANLRIPLLVANGRIRRRDVRKYRLARSFFAYVLNCAAWIGVQSSAERERYLAIGAPPDRVVVAGNLKVDAALADGVESARVAPDSSGRPLLVAGSTHAPEERWLLECARLLQRDDHSVRLALAPRQIGRAPRVARLARSLGFRTCLWSEVVAAGATATDWDVLILDQYATLRACYANADITVVGGTFTSVGGHNILEPAALGRPILVGPCTDEIDALVHTLAEANAVIRISGVDPARGLAEQCKRLLADRRQAQAMGERAAEVCRQISGGAARCARAVARKIDASSTLVEATDADAAAMPNHG